ncbi:MULTISPECIES: polysaccharide export protein EpsE [Ramlibacter]|uniref:Polysaccharide export protein EpsE n=1 Tax=Ramlibacter aquaticus TaxID=2780094 RepID=A0ABR9SH66_9BURK|nr:MULTISPECIES: polysaccharide export protein EpsE [Ramlibacter]MBE7941701.1 polysaccharide export protein EpsE [Ramlibacter aquaticus]
MRTPLLRLNVLLAAALAAASVAAQDAQPAVVAPRGAAPGMAAPAQAARPEAPTQPGTVAGADYRLSPGDSIKVQVYQNPELGLETRVSDSGVVNYPLVGAVQLGGLTVTEAETRIATALKQGGILKAPQVNINVLQVRGSQVAVLGEVQKPGRVPLETTGMRASEVLAAAGGITPSGGDVLTVTGRRGGQPFRKNIDIPALLSGSAGSEDVVIQPGDSLYVAKAPTYYIYGEAQKPGHYRVEPGMTVMQAIAAGGGVTPRGSESRVRLTRKSPDGRTQELSPRLTDPVQPGDVLFVRESLF